MKKSPFYLLFLIFVLVPGKSFSQQTYPISIPPVIPPSPDAAALGKYGNTPVGLYTGIPEINIPLYTIKTKRLEVPISVSYHALGNKVSEVASWIGLGWSLNAGGAVSRSVVGRPDYPDGFWSSYTIKTASQITSSDHDYLKAISDGLSDGESDYYFYNFNGRSGKFIYPQNNSQTPYLIPQVPIAISFTSNRFEIKDEMGVLYKFATVEYSEFTDENNFTTTYPSSYYLSEIISADDIEHIYFTYTLDTSYTVTDNFYTETIGQECIMPPIPSNGLHTSAWYTNTTRITAVRLKEINFTGGKIEFIKDYSRNDRPESRLQEIRISGKNTDGTFSLLKTIILGEGYFITPGSEYFKDRNRLKLTEIIEKDLQGNTNKKYSFNYNEDVMLPARTSLARDWWGYYNGQVGNSSLINSETITFEGYQYNVGSANRAPNPTYMQACILKRINYPTGGYTEFDYEPNFYELDSIAGGLRIKEIRDYEKAGTVPVKKIYHYGSGNKGLLLIPSEGLTNYKQIIDFTWWSQYCTPDCFGKRMIITGRPQYDLTGLNGAVVVYPEARIYEENSTTKPNGMQKLQFKAYAETIIGVDRAYCNGRFQLNDSWKGGDETKSEYYIGNTSNKSQEVTSNYTIYLNNSITGTKVGRKMIHEGICTYVPPNIADFYYFDYPVYSGLKKLTSSTARQYSSLSQSDYVETSSTYDYQNLDNLHQQLTRKTVTNSAGTSDVTKYWYPKDYNSTTISGSLLNAHIISVPIKEERYHNGYLISGKVTEYTSGLAILTKYIYLKRINPYLLLPIIRISLSLRVT